MPQDVSSPRKVSIGESKPSPVGAWPRRLFGRSVATPTCRSCGGDLSASGTHCLVCGEPTRPAGPGSSVSVADAEGRVRDAALPGGAPERAGISGLVGLLIDLARGLATLGVRYPTVLAVLVTALIGLILVGLIV